MKLSYLIKDCTPVWCRRIEPAESQDGNGEHITMLSDPDITSIHSSAGDVKPGGLFIAIKGFKADGHDFIAQAIINGAVAIISERKIFKAEIVEILSANGIDNGIDRYPAIVEVQDSRKAMSSIASRFYGDPSASMVVIGITGTNGKTTTAFMIESILKENGFNTGVIGTVNYRYGDKSFDNPVTTPESIDLQRIMRDMKAEGVSHVVMEVSSHAIDLHRVRDCSFDVAVFTNLTQDHLDYHKTMSAYFSCKKRLFTRLLKRGKKADAGISVVNINNSYGRQIASEVRGRLITTGEVDNALHYYSHIGCRDIIDDITGLKGRIDVLSRNPSEISETAENSEPRSLSMNSRLAGSFNLENILGAVGAAHALGVDSETIERGINGCLGVPGRLERVQDSYGRYVFVDYAHTPDALESILRTLKNRAPRRLISVFGCGGDRDRTKRPIMGEIACRYSDIVIATSDNPRTEDPMAIIEEIIVGIDRAISERGKPERIVIEPDRKKALEVAVSLSESDDIVVAAGKGHETYQVTAHGKIDFDDRLILRDAFEKEYGGCSACSGTVRPGHTEDNRDSDFREYDPIPWKFADVAEALASCLTIGSEAPGCNVVFRSVSTDSRAINCDELFVALKGDRFDGHDFVLDLIRDKKISGFVVDSRFYENLTPDMHEVIRKSGAIIFPVNDTLNALGRLAEYQRFRAGVKVVAITGSNGKTSTRRMVASIFEQHTPTLSTEGNLNNEIGVPLTLLKLSHEHEWAVIEMGMNHRGEISRLSKIAHPDIAVITNTTDAHLEGLGTVENVASAKAEIVDGMNAGGILILNRMDPRWPIVADRAECCTEVASILFFGEKNSGSQFYPEEVNFKPESIEFSLIREKRSDTDSDESFNGFKLRTPAPFMLGNAVAAVAVALSAGIPAEAIRKGLHMFEPGSGRMKIHNMGSVNLIDDTYNANPGSVRAALETLSRLGGDMEKIAVLGDMLELGERSIELHRSIGRAVADTGVSRLFVYGGQSAYTAEGALEAGLAEKLIFRGTKDEIADDLCSYVSDRIGSGVWILIKGSRGMKMEKIVEALMIHVREP